MYRRFHHRGIIWEPHRNKNGKKYLKIVTEVFLNIDKQCGAYCFKCFSNIPYVDVTETNLVCTFPRLHQYYSWPQLSKARKVTLWTTARGCTTFDHRLTIKCYGFFSVNKRLLTGRQFTTNIILWCLQTGKHWNPFLAGALPRTPLRELMMLPRSLCQLGRGTPTDSLPHSTPQIPSPPQPSPPSCAFWIQPWHCALPVSRCWYNETLTN